MPSSCFVNIVIVKCNIISLFPNQVQIRKIEAENKKENKRKERKTKKKLSLPSWSLIIPVGKLMPNATPKKPWQHIIVDFITDLL